MQALPPYFLRVAIQERDFRESKKPCLLQKRQGFYKVGSKRLVINMLASVFLEMGLEVSGIFGAVWFKAQHNVAFLNA